MVKNSGLDKVILIYTFMPIKFYFRKVNDWGQVCKE